MTDFNDAPPSEDEHEMPAPPPPAPEQPAPPPQNMKRHEDWAAMKNEADWIMAAARQLRSWPIHKEVTEAEHDAAVAEVQTFRIG